MAESPFTCPGRFATPKPALGFLLAVITNDAGPWEGVQLAIFQGRGVGCRLDPVGPPQTGEEALGCRPEEWKRLPVSGL